MLTTLLLAAAVSSPFDQVVAAERAFAAGSIKLGQHNAFLNNLSADAIAFNPLPEPARPLHENQAPPKGSLQWGPSWVAVSSAGDLAVSTGPWRIQVADKGPLTDKQVQGWFISMWRLQPDGKWKVAVDAGVSSPMTYELPDNVANGSSVASGPRASDAATATLGITTAETAFAAAAKNGIGGAIEAVADPQLRVYREGQSAVFGADASKSTLAADQRKVSCATDKLVASKSGDLGYTYGTCTAADLSTTKYGFLHVWRIQANGTWKVLVDVTP